MVVFTNDKIAGIYLRVSTEDQDPLNQIADVRMLAEALHYKVKDIYIYIDKESGQYSDRKEFQRMMADAEAGKFQVLFIWALDRFSREGIKATLEHIERLKEFGVGIKSYQEQWLDTTNDGIWQLLVAVMSWAAKEELKRFRERSMAGKRTRLDQNKLIGCYPPYGYTHKKREKDKGIDAEFIVNEAEADIVRKIFVLYLRLHSIFLVARELFRQGIKTRGRNGAPRYFSASMVKKILVRDDYATGNHYYGKTSPCVPKFHIKKDRKHKLTGRILHPKAEWKIAKIPTIINMDTFQKVQEIMEERARRRARLSKYQSLCRGKIRCVRCNRIYGTRNQKDSRTGKDYLLYRCPQCSMSSFNEPICRAKTISVHKLDTIVWSFISFLIMDKQKVRERARLVRERRNNERTENQRTYDALLAEKDSIKKQKDNLLELYSKTDSLIVKNDIEQKLVEFDAREKSVDNDILRVKIELESIADKDSIDKEIEEMFSIYKDKIENPTFEIKFEIVQRWVGEVNILDNGQIRIKVKVPAGENAETFLVDTLPLSESLAQRVSQVKLSADNFTLSEQSESKGKCVVVRNKINRTRKNGLKCLFFRGFEVGEKLEFRDLIVYSLTMC